MYASCGIKVMWVMRQLEQFFVLSFSRCRETCVKDTHTDTHGDYHMPLGLHTLLHTYLQLLNNILGE